MGRRSMTFVGFIVGFAILMGGRDGRALAQEGPPPPPDQPVPPPSPDVVVTAPPAAGQWLDTAEYGWVWVPAGTVTYAVGDLPCAYLYTPTYGWTWYASPWGWGHFTVGAWVARRSPYGYRAWAHGPRGWGWHRAPRTNFHYGHGHGHPHRGYPRAYAPHHGHAYRGRGHHGPDHYGRDHHRGHRGHR